MPFEGQHQLVHVCVLICSSCVSHLATTWTVAHQTPLTMEFSQQEYWSRLPCPSLGALPNPEIKPASPVSPALQADSLPPSHWKGLNHLVLWTKCVCPLNIRMQKP